MAHVKRLYRCVIKYQREVQVRRTKAYSDKQARMMVINQLARAQDVEPYIVANYFQEHPGGITVEEEEK